ncbi:MAG TPA: LuxR C-terminal-related transcriptional regulator [Coleofasciculaceae cyanobacterium]|jgi:DNA-binding CsgD family transcriptional regulator
MTYSAVESANPNAPIAHQQEFSHSLQSSHLEPIVYSGHALLRAVVESWVDGILILTEQRQWVEANEAARQVCGQLMKAQCSAQSNPSRQGAVPKAIWKVCQELIQSRQTFPHQPIVVESEINVEGLALRIRVRWFGVEETDRPYLMVILEDRHQSNLQRAIAEVDQFHLSPREAEVWLLYRCGYRYKEIAQELYICADTVKKHLRSIRAKRQGVKLS